MFNREFHFKRSRPVAVEPVQREAQSGSGKLSRVQHPMVVADPEARTRIDAEHLAIIPSAESFRPRSALRGVRVAPYRGHERAHRRLGTAPAPGEPRGANRVLR